MFRITEPYSLEQFMVIQGVLRNYRKESMVVYQSNWYLTIACADEAVARTIRVQLSYIDQWETDIAPGRKNKVRHYLRIKFKRE